MGRREYEMVHRNARLRYSLVYRQDESQITILVHIARQKQIPSNNFMSLKAK